MDLTQDSDEENSKARNKTQGKRVNEMDDVEEYFDKPVHSKGQVRISVFTLRKYDFLLGVAFNSAQRGARLYSRVWAAAKAHRLYLNLKTKVMNTLKSIQSKITLIDDVWTTKGNRHAFMGILAAYIGSDWAFHTTDSGSNNGTMAAEVDRLIYKKTGVRLNISQNHIRCFCHKLALILNAGLKALELASEGITKTKKSTLGFVPGLVSIDEAPEEVIDADKDNEYGSDDEDYLDRGDDNGDENGICDSNDENVSEEVMCRSTSHTAQVLKKVDFQRITLSAAKQSEFNTWSKKLEYHGPTLIAGYGIRLNIKYESRNHGYQACNVINKLIENKKDPQERDGGKDFFNKYEISRGNWEIVKKLNDILREFYYITKKMEGDSSSACLMLSKYKAWYPSHYSRVEALLSKHFNQQTVDIKANASQVISSLSASDEIRTDPKDIQHHCQVHTVNFFPDASSSTHLIELSIYLSGKYKLATDQAGQSLKWWKEHHQEFPVLSSLAKDFLACCSTSASVKRCFSAAADICGRDCGSLAVRTIE
ncbi:hypothetical protein PCASD_00718 [Puccinia coronata f. sp. avenae]|uniref:HAT C-terminal dimerisation domain-containing protein n=1 Tax=Puccinia coronata f. sp. avenae TaxID=200324 RepID=A0A2N5VL17_9BASI|nr:hypothetical protein PCASD_00718 [Puccinia coronata f. sp. avenae]